MLKTGQFLPALIQISQEAGKAILKIYETDFDISYKDDHSPLTIADRNANEIITSRLSVVPFNGFPLLSEEGRDIDYEERKRWEYFWLVDPLDGTKEFIRRNDEFTVNIALIKKDRPVAAVIYAPVKDIFYFASEDTGSYRLSGSMIIDDSASTEDLIARADRLPLTYRQSLKEGPRSPIRVIASRSHRSKETEHFISIMKDRYGEVEIIPSGSSLKFCIVAEGRADLYPRFGPTMEWDTAAGQCIVEESGGKVALAGSGEILMYNKKDLTNPWFLVSGAGQKQA